MKKDMLRKFRKFITMPSVTAAMLVCAAVLIIGGGANSARAALTYYSENYTTRVSMDNIGVTILEDGSRLSWRDYSDRSDGTWDEAKGVLKLDTDEPNGSVKPGVKYGEELSVQNSGDIDSYVRVVITKYWENPNGTRCQELSPDLIRLEIPANGWIIDSAASTEERTVLYYTQPLAVGEITTPFLESVMIDKSVADMVVETREKNGKYTTITTSFAYNGVKMGLEIETDAVQTHSAAEAAWSAWGQRISISGDGTLSLR